MSLLLRVKLSPLKQLYPSLLARFSTSVSLSAKRKTSEETLRDLEAGEAILAKIAETKFPKTNARELFLSRFKGKKTGGLQKFRELSAEEKEEFEKKAIKENKKRLERAVSLSLEERQQVKLYKQVQEKGTFVEIKLKALATDLPKKPSHPFGLFVKENYAKHSHATGESTSATLRSLAKKWSSLPDSQKQRYSEKFEDLKEQYEANFNKWVKMLSKDERVLFASKGRKYLTKDQRSALSSPSPYRAFIKKEFASIKGKSTGSLASQQKLFSEIIKEAQRKWKALSEGQRQSYA